MSDRISSKIPWAVDFDAIGDPRQFFHCGSSAKLDGLALVAAASTAVAVKVAHADQPTLLVPFAPGKNVSLCDGGQRLIWQQHDAAVLMPACARGGQSDIRSVLMIDFAPERLAATAAAMLGCSIVEAPDFALDQARTVPLRAGHLNFDVVLRHLCRSVDLYATTPSFLALSGLDDSFYRAMVTMLHPELFFDAGKAETRGVVNQLDGVCQYIQAHLAQVITLSELDRISTLSRRQLQYAFLQRYDCTPMQWVHEQRLLRVHARLATATPGDTVTSVALSCGFTSLGRFAGEYQRRFGELPSATLAR